MNEDITGKRLNDLEDNIHQDLDMLKEYEDKLRYEIDPRRMAEYRREIERQRESLTRYQKEYDELRRQMTPEELQNVTDLLQQKDAKLDKIQKLLPPIWNISQHRNPNFTGREGIMKALRLALISGEPAAWKQAITGMGGVGKTQLAVEYIYRHKTEYRVIWWVRSEELATMAADYASLAVDLNLPEKDSTDQTEIAKAVKRWLEHNPGWLLIFDNAQDPGEIRNYLPQGGAGHVIITSRNPLWGGVAKLMPARVFDRAESIEFLCKRTGQEDKKAADALADELGDLPLALEQAGAYIETTGISLSEYQELFQSRRKELWEDESHPPDYPDSVATTWSLAMEQVSQESQAAADLLNLCAFLAPDDISLELLCGGVEHLPEPLAATTADKLAMNRAIKALRQYSLIDTSGESLSVHRLVQAVVRDRLSEDDRKRWTETVVRLLSSAFRFDSDDVRTWHQCSRLLPHALAAATHAESREVAPDVTSHILNQTGMYSHGRAEFAEAKVLFERALTLAEEAYGPDHPEVATDVNNLGSVLRALGDLKGAKELFARALKIDEEAYGPDHPHVAILVNNLGSVLQDLGDLKGAKELFARALKIDEEAYGPDHPQVARDVNNLGGVLRALGDLKGAKELFERALKIDEEAYGPDHPHVARDVNNLGGVLQDLGDLKGAKELFERALEIDEEAYGPDHPQVARDVNNIGSVLRALGDLKGAKELFERALSILRKSLGETHQSTATVRNNLELLANV
ncbi:MAG: FxSxx-COOH system tetratricopeptide repeat protein [Halobacteriota archaeon]